jgi:hypothetical protein
MPYPPKALVDHRIYTIKLRKMPEFIEVFNRLAMPVLMQTLGHPLGFYTSQVGPLNQFVTCGATTTWRTTSGAAMRATRIPISRPT